MQAKPLPERYYELRRQLDLVDSIITHTQPDLIDENVQHFRMQKFQEILQEMNAIAAECYYSADCLSVKSKAA